MPIRHVIVHLIDKKPDGNPAMLHVRDAELGDSQAIENLMADLNESYNAKPNKIWGLFQEESGAFPFSGWLAEYLDGGKDFVEFSRQALEHQQRQLPMLPAQTDCFANPVCGREAKVVDSLSRAIGVLAVVRQDK